jgi:hypothetical protein
MLLIDVQPGERISDLVTITAYFWEHEVTSGSSQWFPSPSLIIQVGINPHKDTPVEILHTWLLGNTKYIWHHTNMQWDNKGEQLFAIRLQSSDIAGLTTPKPRANYLVQYKNSLIGKHFKILGQLAVFHLHDLCSDLVFSMWKAAGELGAMLWFPEIRNLEQYLVS